MDRRQTLIVLDRDGVLNRTVPSPAEPRPDSPLSESEAEVFPWVPDVLRELTAAGFGLVVASNQPAAAKGKATRAALDAVHAEILRQAQAAGGVVLSSHICFHRAEDGCACRKPRTGLLRGGLRAPPALPAGRLVDGGRPRQRRAGGGGLRNEDRVPGRHGQRRLRGPDRRGSSTFLLRHRFARLCRFSPGKDPR